MKDYERFYQLTRFLRRRLPFSHPVHFRRINIRDGLDGECIFKNGRFIICVDKTLPEASAIEVLIHEAAHPLSWGKDKDVHGPNWGKAYSLVYRHFLEFNEQ
jgi:hypothetical protein